MAYCQFSPFGYAELKCVMRLIGRRMMGSRIDSAFRYIAGAQFTRGEALLKALVLICFYGFSCASSQIP